MDVIVHIPDDLADPPNVAAGDLPRRALEALALEEYKGRRLSRAQLRRLLGFETRFELDDFLKAHDVHADVTIEELNRQMQDLKSLGL